MFNEIDQSYVPQVVLGRAEAAVGTSPKGRAFVPTTVQTWEEFEALFGGIERSFDGKPLRHGPYCAYYTLMDSSPFMYVRTLGINPPSSDASARKAGYAVGGAYAITYTGSNGTSSVAAIVHSKGTLTCVGNVSDDSFILTIPGYGIKTCSFTNGLSKILNTVPAAYPDITLNSLSSSKHYLAKDFSFPGSLGDATGVSASIITNGNSYLSEYTHANTPWIQSQNYGSSEADATRYSLFQFHALGDGEYENTNIKVTISNIQSSINTKATEYGSFSISVRQFSDSDAKPVVLESFTGLSLDPTNVNYILRRIGDNYVRWDTTEKKLVREGSFGNKSSYIRIVMNPSLMAGNVPKGALPWGYDASIPKISRTACNGAIVPSLPVSLSKVIDNQYRSYVCWGFSTTDASGSSYSSLGDRLGFIPTAVTKEYDPIFSLDFLSHSVPATPALDGNLTYNYMSGNISTSYVSSNSLEIGKFTVPFFGGFDGLNIHYRDPFDNFKIADFSTFNYGNPSDWVKSYEVASLEAAVDTLSNPDDCDFKDLAIPGIYHPGILGYGFDMVENRSDCFMIGDISGSTVGTAKTWRETSLTRDSSYGAIYWPTVMTRENLNTPVKDPVVLYPTAVMLGVLGLTDRMAQPWYAPAGFNRGVLSPKIKAIGTTTNVTDRNTLYDRQINCIALLEGDFVVWGQKTLQVKASALDRVNVRRMINHIKKAFSGYSKYMIFENVNNQLFESFLNIANPFLVRIVQGNGLNSYKLIMDSSNNTPTTKMNNEVHCKLILEPTLTGEKFIFDFVITRQGVLGE